VYYRDHPQFLLPSPIVCRVCHREDYGKTKTYGSFGALGAHMQSDKHEQNLKELADLKRNSMVSPCSPPSPRSKLDLVPRSPSEGGRRRMKKRSHEQISASKQQTGASSGSAHKHTRSQETHSQAPVGMLVTPGRGDSQTIRHLVGDVESALSRLKAALFN